MKVNTKPKKKYRLRLDIEFEALDDADARAEASRFSTQLGKAFWDTQFAMTLHEVYAKKAPRPLIWPLNKTEKE